jgi:DNA-binding transcriptional regulator YdaS (Cro superfamily)
MENIKQKVIDEIGSATKLAEIAGVSLPAVSQWDEIPIKHVLKIEKAVKSKITRYDMRPDIYGEA